MRFKGLAEIILGLWLFVSAFVGLSLRGASINDFTVGIVVVSISFILARSEPWQSWIAGILGFYLIIAARIPLLVSGVGLCLNDIIVGSIIMLVGLMILVHGKKLAHHAKTVDHFNYRNYGSE